MFFNGKTTQPTGCKGNFGAVGVLKGVEPGHARRFYAHVFLMAGFLAFSVLGGCAGNNNAELATKINTSYHTNFSAHAQPVLLSSAF